MNFSPADLRIHKSILQYVKAAIGYEDNPLAAAKRFKKLMQDGWTSKDIIQYIRDLRYYEFVVRKDIFDLKFDRDMRTAALECMGEEQYKWYLEDIIAYFKGLGAQNNGVVRALSTKIPSKNPIAGAKH